MLSFGRNVSFAWMSVLLAGATLYGCSSGDASASSAGQAPSAAPLVSEEDRKLLEQMKQKEQARQDLAARPWDFVTSGDGNVQTYDKGIINDYTEIKQFPVHNTTEFDIRKLEGEVTILKADDSALATVPVQFQGELLAHEEKIMPVTSSTVQGKGAKFRLKITSVTLYSK